MRKLLVLALLAFGAYKSYGYFMQSSVAAFDENGNPQTLLFTFDGCAPCNDAVKLLKQRKIAFNEYNVSTSTENQQLLRDYGGRRQLPYAVSGNRSAAGFQKDEFVGMLAEVYGESVLTRQERKLMKNNFDTAGKPVVVMYSTETCGYCKKARDLFESKGVNFVERDIKKSSSAKRDFAALHGHGTPLIYIGYRRVSGFNESKLKDAINVL